MLKLYVSSLSKYLNGRENGRWLKLPMDNSKLEDVLNEIKGNTEELIILDYDAPFEIGEYENIINLNDLCWELEVSEITKEQLTVLFMAGDNKEETFLKIINSEYVIINTEEINTNGFVDGSDFAMYLYDNGYINFLGELSDEAYDFINWDKVWKNCEIAYNWKEIVYTDNGVYNTYIVNI